MVRKNIKEKNFKRASITTSEMMSILIIFCLFAILVILLYFLYINIPGKPEKLDIEVKNLPEVSNLTNTFSNVEQFYPNMKFNHNRISYKIDSTCSFAKKSHILNAFQEISDNVEALEFYEISESPDVSISCSEEEEYDSDEKYFISGEGGAKEVIKTGRYNIINNGIIFLYNPKQTNFLGCATPVVEIHELMHVFGFAHSDNKKSLMYPYLESCDQKLDKSIIRELERLYSEENLPDLYFEDVAIIKKGRYLDFNLTIKNSGSINAENVKFSVFDNDELVESRGLGDIAYGAGIFIEINNFKLIHKNPDKISFILDSDNLIKEINEDNNIANINLGIKN